MQAKKVKTEYCVSSQHWPRVEKLAAITLARLLACFLSSNYARRTEKIEWLLYKIHFLSLSKAYTPKLEHVNNYKIEKSENKNGRCEFFTFLLFCFFAACIWRLHLYSGKFFKNLTRNNCKKRKSSLLSRMAVKNIWHTRSSCLTFSSKALQVYCS